MPRRPEHRSTLHHLAGRAALLLLAVLAGSGCVTSRVEESKNTATGISNDESIVVFATSYHSGNKTESGFLDCVNDELDDGRDALNVYPSQRFRDELFPWFEPRTMPQSIEALPELLARPGVAERITQRGVRYLVLVKGSTEETSGGGGMSCAAGPTGGACFGLLWWENDGSYEATVWDLRKTEAAGAVSTDVHGTSMVPALIVPLPFIARTQTAACKSLARELQQFIVQEGPS
ncbi:MAG: hypothetical protein E4H19_02750 [Chromatiales bacterium]|nr:MAG: hypothetical protein E4H19_02750 [Chromatiales bacterium]